MALFISPAGNVGSTDSTGNQGAPVSGDLRCPCCFRLHRTELYYRHMESLSRLADLCGFGLVVMSGYRCPAYNRLFGGAFDSWHLLFATDVAPDTEGADYLELIYRLGGDAGYTGIGLNSDRAFVHLDLRYPPRSWRV